MVIRGCADAADLIIDNSSFRGILNTQTSIVGPGPGGELMVSPLRQSGLCSTLAPTNN